MPTLAATPVYEPDPGMLVVVGALAAVWYLVMVLVTIARWPKLPRPGPETTELGPEPPAVANLVVGRMGLDKDAVPATLLDLAARGLIDIEDRGIRNYVVRLRTRPKQVTPTPYEKRVLDHLRGLARNGEIPAGALTTGPDDNSERWFKSFRKEVVAEAQERGLCRDMWGRRSLLLAAGSAGLIYLVFSAALGFNEIDEVKPSGLLNVVTMMVYGGVVAFILLVGNSRQRDTPAGRAAAGRWLGVRDALEASPSFGELPPSGVVVWERHLAYAAALGVAGAAVKALPLGAEDDRHAWTDYDGSWKHVTIRYPWFRPGWGRHPWAALGLGFLLALVGVAALRGVISISDDVRDAAGDLPWVAAAIAFVGALTLLAIAWGAALVYRGAMDLVARRTITGEVLRTRVRGAPSRRRGSGESNPRYYVAVYDGSSNEIDAWRVSAKKYPWFHQGGTVTVTVTPRLGFVYDREQV
ncbi:MAG TPA: hypothetical protein VJ927_02920 [Actinomycetota bacterium]|nr:hypothetical protein [Actinomycetota bacterium]